MDLTLLRDLVVDINFEAHGLDVVVELPDRAPINTRAIWMTPSPELMPPGTEFQRREAIRVIALRREDVPRLPAGTPILAPEKSGGRIRAWVVDGHDRQEAHHNRAIVRLDATRDAQLAGSGDEC